LANFSEYQSASFVRKVISAAVAIHDATYGRVGLERGGVNGDGLAHEQSRRHRPLLHPGEDRAVTLEVDDAARSGSVK